jgi:hypothetical protein
LTPLGDRLVYSTKEAASHKQGKKKECYHYVKQGLAAEGINLDGRQAYKAAPQLARDPHFREVKIPRDDLERLPAGAVVVWNRNPKAGHLSGHISVAMGDGNEVSDRIRPQVTNYRSQYRVFLPVEGQGGAMMVAGNRGDDPSTTPS